MLNPQRGTAGQERLAVYAGGYVERTRQALADIYEAVAHVVGSRRFAELAQTYARRYPSHEYNLSLRGRHLAEFLIGHPLSHRLPFLPDLARLEWLIAQAFHAFDEPPLEPLRVAGLSLDQWEQRRIAFQPSVGCLASPWPVRDLWDARTRPVSEISIDVVNRPQRVLIFRKDLRVMCELMEEGPFRMLAALRRGATLGEACRTLAEWARESDPPVAAWCSAWVQRGLVVNIF